MEIGRKMSTDLYSLMARLSYNEKGDCSVEWSPLLYLVLKWNVNKMHMALSYLSICSFTCSASNPTVLSTTVPLLSITKQVGVD